MERRRRFLYLLAAAPLGLSATLIVRRALYLPVLPAFLRPRRPLSVGECTWYAWGRAREAGWEIRFDVDHGRHARHWWTKVVNARRTDRPVKGAVLVFDAWGANPYGHVGYVESVAADGSFEITHANFAVGQPDSEREGVTVYRARAKVTAAGVSLEGGPPLPLRGFLAP